MELTEFVNASSDGDKDRCGKLLSLSKNLLFSDSYTNFESASMGLVRHLCLGLLENGSLLFDTNVK